MNTRELETSIVQIGEETPTDVLIAAGDKIARLAEFLRTVKGMWEEKMVERIQTTGPIEHGDIRYYVGTKRTTKCQNVPGTVESLLTAVEGDFTRFCEHLSSGAIKYGAARGTLPQAEYERLFMTVEEPELKEGKPVKQLQKVNTRFIEQRSRV